MDLDTAGKKPGVALATLSLDRKNVVPISKLAMTRLQYHGQFGILTTLYVN
jgi:hypothetical protein